MLTRAMGLNSPVAFLFKSINMKITGITIVKDNIVVELDTKIPDSVDSDLYLYIDTLNNYSNRSSVNPDKHSYRLLVLGTDYSSDVKIDE